MDITKFVVNNWYLFAALLVVVYLLLAGPISQLIYKIRPISPLHAVQLVNRDSGVFLDVCEPQEFKSGHIPNAVNLPLRTLAENLKHVDKYKAKPVIVTCRSGNRSVKGAIVLRKHGFESVYSLSGGLAHWERDNLPMEKG
jgi:rhodanese-related sulfurtransferase